MELKQARPICDNYLEDYNKTFKPTENSVCGFMERGDLLAAICQSNDAEAGVDDDWEISETVLKTVQWVIPDTLLVRIKDKQLREELERIADKFSWDVMTAMDNKIIRDNNNEN